MTKREDVERRRRYLLRANGLGWVEPLRRGGGTAAKRRNTRRATGSKQAKEKKTARIADHTVNELVE